MEREFSPQHKGEERGRQMGEKETERESTSELEKMEDAGP